jgi:hypothetical protein
MLPGTLCTNGTANSSALVARGNRLKVSGHVSNNLLVNMLVRIFGVADTAIVALSLLN